MACYFDESNRGEVWAVAGYVASVRTWNELFAPAWERTLQGGPHPISEYKAANCNSGRGEFSSWSKDDCDQLTRALVSVIVESCPESDLVGFATALVFPGVPDPTSPRVTSYRKNLEDVGFGRCIGMTLYEAVGTAAKSSGRDRVHVCVDRKDGSTSRLGTNFQIALETLGEPELTAKIDFPVSGDSKAVLPLQAADLLAHETVKEIWNRCEGRPTRGSLEALVGGKFHRARCFDFPPLTEVKRFQAGGEQAPMFLHVLFESGKGIRAPGNWRCG
jgi:hypothetical protein